MTKGYLTVNGTGSKDIYGGKRKGLGPKKRTHTVPPETESISCIRFSKIKLHISFCRFVA